MNYYLTIHALELIYFDFNSQEKAVVSFRFFPLSAIALKKFVTQAFTCNSYVYNAWNDVKTV